MGTVVCAVDDTAEAMEALRVAAQLSGEAGLRLVVVHVEEVTGGEPELRHLAEEHGRRLLDGLLVRQGLDGGVDRRVEVGEPARELARVAAEEAASVIVVGSGRRRWWQPRRTRGLMAELAATAACPVVVAPPAMPR